MPDSETHSAHSSAFEGAELRALYSASPVGVAVLDRELRYRRVNEALARMNGRTAAAHVGASLEEVLGDAAAELRAALQEVMETRLPLEVEVSAPLPDDPAATRAFEATYFPVVGDGDELLGVGAIVREVTDRRELEEEQSRLLRDALLARAQAEAAEVRADDAREEAERERAAAESARERVAFLAQAGSEMAGAVDWEDTVRAVVHSGVPALADWAGLTLVEPNGRPRLVAVSEDDPERASLAGEMAGRAVETGELAATADHVVAPLKTPAGVIGALSFARTDPGQGFSPEHIDLVTNLADRAALHLHNARLYSERSHIARTLQASLRPSALPEIPGAEVAAGFLAAGDQNEVGGDFYDVFLSGPDVWTVIVGDVSGKGAEAATLTSLARHTLRTASMLHDEPAANLALLNRALQAQSARAEFCTVLYARMCAADTGFEFRFSNGGHAPPLLLRPDGSVETVDAGRGPLVGAFPDVGFTEATFGLEPGQLLLLYTDGVTEVRTEDFTVGERELRTTLAAHAGASAQEVVAAVERRAVELQEGAPRDDITLLAIRAHDNQERDTLSP